MIRIATEQDLLQVEEIYNELLEQEAKTVSYTNWQKGLYPTITHAKRALEQNTLFVGEENNVLYGCVILNQIQPSEYADASWNFPAEPEEVMVIHTLCIRPSWKGKGKGRELVGFCEEYAHEKGWPIIRLDTYEGNTPACNLYLSLGYSYAGITKFHFEKVIWENLKCFDKHLQQ